MSLTIVEKCQLLEELPSRLTGGELAAIRTGIFGRIDLVSDRFKSGANSASKI
jgi:hypothetical protein